MIAGSLNRPPNTATRGREPGEIASFLWTRLLFVDTLDIIRQVETDPGLRTQLRAMLLTEEILQLPLLVAENSRDIRDLKEVVASLERGQESLVRGQESLERDQESLHKEVGSLSAVVGGTVEDDARLAPSPMPPTASFTLRLRGTSRLSPRRSEQQ